MSTDCSAPRDGLDSARRDAPPRQAAAVVALHRLARLVACLARLYVYARAIAPRLPDEWRARDMHRWAGRLLAALDVAVQVRGHRPAADAPLLVVANHISWLDSYAINTVTQARFVAKSEVGGWPVVGAVARAFGTFFIKRHSCRAAARTAAALAEALVAGTPVAAFPEGTTSRGRELLWFYPAMFQAAVWSGARVQPVAIRYRDGCGRRTDAPAYVGDLSVLDSVRRLMREPRVTAELVFCAPIDPSGRTRRELAALARSAIAAALRLAEDGAAAAAPLRRAA
jgi:1-acyl-sn-glycerol-3-phosphate acyltransferase